MKRFCGLLAAASIGIATLVSGAVQADVIVLDFEGIYTSYPGNNNALIGDFYNGGTSSIGTSGTDYGVSFSGNALALCLNTTDTYCSNASRGGQGNPDSQLTGLFFLDGDETYMNVAAGFETGFSFYYAAPVFTGSVSVFDDLNGQGNLLATIDLALTAIGACSSYSANYCPFVPVGVLFDGIAKSVSFAGTANFIVFDDITFGSDIPDPTDPTNPIPAPAAFMMLGLGLSGMGWMRRRKVA